MLTFYFGYQGSKRLDYKHYKSYIEKLTDINKFIEPFGGSGATSYLYYLDHKSDKIEYIINDIDPFLNKLNKHIKTKGIKSLFEYINKNLNSNTFETIKAKTNKSLEDEFYFKRVYVLRTGINPFKNKDLKRFIKPIDYKKLLDREKFDKLNKHFEMDYMDIFNKYIDDEQAFIFLDPPYFSSCNREYYGVNADKKKVSNVEIKIMDKTKLFIDILNFLKNAKCKVLLIINENAITEYLYKDFIKDGYYKKYSNSYKIDNQYMKKSTRHLIITNY